MSDKQRCLHRTSIERAMELATDSPYIRGVNLWCLTAPLATLLEVSFPDPKVAPHPNFLGFSPLSKRFLKIFSPRAPGSIRRALNRLAALSPSPKTPKFRGKTTHPHLTATPKSRAKHRPGTLKNPPLTPLHIKKLSKVRSTLLTPLPGECILEYMRLKEPRRPPHTGRSA